MGRSTLLAIWIMLAAILFLRIFFLLSQPLPQAGQIVSFSSTVLSEPTLKGNVARFEVARQGRKYAIWTGRFPQYHYGDDVTITGAIEEKSGKQDTGVLSKFHTDFTMYFPKIEAKKGGNWFLAVTKNIRQHIILTIRQFLPSNSAALLAGILLGAKEGFSEDFYQALRNTGTLHVVAASGMNVSILASFLMAVLLRFLKRRVAAVFVVIAILFYVFLAALQPAIVRAAIMGVALFTGSILDRQTHAAWVLGLTCYIMILFDPLLIFDIGFQLSFAATAGLLLLFPMFEKRFGWFKKVKGVPIIGESATTTVVAQIATLPILLANFGSISILSIPVNALILWTSQPIMFLGIAAAILSVVPTLSYPMLLTTLPLLLFFEKMVLLFNQPRFLVALTFPFMLGIGYYLLLIAGCFFKKKRHSYESK